MADESRDGMCFMSHMLRLCVVSSHWHIQSKSSLPFAYVLHRRLEFFVVSRFRHITSGLVSCCRPSLIVSNTVKVSIIYELTPAICAVPSRRPQIYPSNVSMFSKVTRTALLEPFLMACTHPPMQVFLTLFSKKSFVFVDIYHSTSESLCCLLRSVLTTAKAIGNNEMRFTTEMHSRSWP